MKQRLALSLLASLLAGCATTGSQPAMDNKTTSAATGAAVGCVGGALLARMTGGKAAAGCAVGAIAGGLVGFEKARREEVEAAARAQQEAVAALSTLPRANGPQAKVGEVKTVEVTATDKEKKETRKFQAFESATVDVPLSARGTPQYNEAIGKLRTLAERVADERGSARIDVALTSADARAHKVDLETATAQTAKGNPVTVTKMADNTVPKGVERFTVRAGPLQHLDV